MPTVTLKTDERLYEQINKMADELHLSKSEVIRRAVSAYSDNLERHKLIKVMQTASFRVRGSDETLLRDLDSLSSDGL